MFSLENSGVERGFVVAALRQYFEDGCRADFPMFLKPEVTDTVSTGTHLNTQKNTWLTVPRNLTRAHPPRVPHDYLWPRRL